MATKKELAEQAAAKAAAEQLAQESASTDQAVETTEATDPIATDVADQAVEPLTIEKIATIKTVDECRALIADPANAALIMALVDRMSAIAKELETNNAKLKTDLETATAKKTVNRGRSEWQLISDAIVDCLHGYPLAPLDDKRMNDFHRIALNASFFEAIAKKTPRFILDDMVKKFSAALPDNIADLNLSQEALDTLYHGIASGLGEINKESAAIYRSHCDAPELGKGTSWFKDGHLQLVFMDAGTKKPVDQETVAKYAKLYPTGYTTTKDVTATLLARKPKAESGELPVGTQYGINPGFKDTKGQQVTCIAYVTQEMLDKIAKDKAAKAAKDAK